MKNENAVIASSSREALLDTEFDLINPVKRVQMIAIAAYFRAQKRGFTPNEDLADWFEAEREIDRHLNSFSS